MPSFRAQQLLVVLISQGKCADDRFLSVALLMLFALLASWLIDLL